MTDNAAGLPDSCDVVIIGSGIGGLTAGGILSKAGLKTEILEADSQAGGYLAGFERKGFKFDTSIHWLSQCGPGGFVNNIFNYIAPGMPECPQLHGVHRFKGETYDYTLTSEPLELRDRLISDFPDERDGIIRLFEDAEKLGKRLDILNYRVRHKETMSLPEKAVYGLKMLAWVLPMIKYIRTPVEDALMKYFKSAELLTVFRSQEKFMAIIVPIAWAYSKNYQAPPIGGSPVLAHWLCEKIKENNSHVALKTRVEQVLVSANNSVSGVKLAGGHTISCKYVIAACDIQSLYNNMLPETAVPSAIKNAVNNADLHESCFNIFLGLDCPANELGFGEEVLNLTTNNSERKDHISGDPHRSVIMIVAQSVRDPSMAPEGKGSMMIMCPAYIDYKNNWATEEGFSRGKSYRDLKAEYADIVLDRIEKAIAPDLRKHIEVMETASPVTYWRYTANSEGTILGSRPTAKNIKANVSHYKTPVKNLFIGGHCAEYGGGVPLAVKAGANSSLLILKDLKHKAFDALAHVMTRNIQ